MADLIDRLSGASEELELPRPKLPAHQFMGGMRLYADGKATRVEIASNWDLQGEEATDAAAIADQIDGAGGTAATMRYVLSVEAVSFMLEDDDDTLYHNPDGTINKTKTRSDLGI